MKIIRAFLCICIMSFIMGCAPKKALNDSGPIFLADPTIFLHQDTYYLYGTTGNAEQHDQSGFLVYTSKDLDTWEGPAGMKDGLALKEGDAFGDKGFWAPQIFEYQKRFYMAYTANEHIAIAVSNSPYGPFVNPHRQAISSPLRQIDPFVFMDEDGRKYLYHVRLEQGNRIFVAELNEDLMGIKDETLKECLSAQLTWENRQEAAWPVAEGPTVLKHKGIYYMLYSANDFRSPDYAVGFATSQSPLGPWKKSNRNPIIHRSIIPHNGTGHGDVFVAKNNDLYYVLHTHFNDTLVQPRRTALLRINFANNGEGPDYLEVDTQSFRFLETSGN